MNNDIYVNYLIFCSFSELLYCYTELMHIHMHASRQASTSIYRHGRMHSSFFIKIHELLFLKNEKDQFICRTWGGGGLFIKHGCLNIRLFYVFVTRDNLCFTQSSFLKLCLNLNLRYLHTILEKKAYTFNISIFTSFVNVNVHDFLSFLIIG